MLRTIRSLDGIAWSTLALLLVVLHPSASLDALGRFNLLYVAPLAAAALFASRMPVDLLADARWQQCVQRLRLSGAGMAALLPFAAWWSVSGGSYLLLCALLGGYLAIAFYFQVISAVWLLARQAEAEELAGTAHGLRYLVLYVPLCTYSALAIVAVLQAAFFHVDVLDTVRTLFFSQPVVRLAVYGVIILWILIVAIAGFLLPLLVNRQLVRHVPAVESPPVSKPDEELP